MPKKAKGLTARQVETIKTPGDHADGNGLYMRIKPSGMKTWLFRYQLNGRRHAMGLGSIRLKSLAQAREKSREFAVKVSDGIDPIQERRSLERKTSITFMDAAALAHTIEDKVVAAYQRGDLFEKRRQLMLDWADYVTSYT